MITAPRRHAFLLATSICAATFSALGVAHARTVYIVPDGLYAGMDPRSASLTFFHIHNHRVYHLRFSLNIVCHNSNTGADYTVNYSAGPAMPQGQTIPADGLLRLDWVESEAGREGHIDMEITFRRRPMASFSVTSTGGYESCNGFAAIYVRRSPLRVPVPTSS